MDPTLHTRRKFLRTSMLGAAASWTLPVFLEKTFFTLDAMAAEAATQAVTGKDGTILVVLQMAGGNDGLNMVVPFGDDAYYRSRPQLGIPAGQILKVDSYAGLNPKLAASRPATTDKPYSKPPTRTQSRCACGKPRTAAEFAAESSPSKARARASICPRMRATRFASFFFLRIVCDMFISIPWWCIG